MRRDLGNKNDLEEKMKQLQDTIWVDNKCCCSWFVLTSLKTQRINMIKSYQNQELFKNFPVQKLQFSSTFFWAFSYIKPCLKLPFFKWKLSRYWGGNVNLSWVGIWKS
jgi:hypothetical protein